MATRFRKSMKIAPGVKLNINKKSVSLTAGTKGAHHTINSNGSTTTSAGVPGSGLSYVHKSSGKKHVKYIDTSNDFISYDEKDISGTIKMNGKKASEYLEKKYKFLDKLSGTSILLSVISLLLSFFGIQYFFVTIIWLLIAAVFKCLYYELYTAKAKELSESYNYTKKHSMDIDKINEQSSCSDTTNMDLENDKHANNLNKKYEIDNKNLLKNDKIKEFSFPDIIDQFYLYRVYDQSIAFAQDCINSINYGDDLNFTPEPDNKYDEDALKIMHNDIFIGYVYKGMIQDMIHDFSKKQCPVFAFYSGEENIGNKKNYKYTIAFYKNLRYLESKTFKLTGIGTIDHNTEEPRKNCFSLLKTGDHVEIDYLHEKEKFLLTYYPNEYTEYELGYIDDMSLCDYLRLFAFVENVTSNKELVIRVYCVNK